ncbi:MAG: transglutaminase family protein [Verrucomicrobiota bacterium]
MRRFLLFLCSSLALPVAAPAETPSPVPSPVPIPAAAAAAPAAESPAPASTGELAKSVRPGLVAIYPSGREGREAGIGSGFVISEDGLIATNLHVIGEGRDIRVEFPDGTSRSVTGIHAWDRQRDLAIVRVAGSGLPFLPLGDSSKTEQGQAVIAMGNPLGYRFSVTEGILSAVREIEGRSMLQVAMPVERGNSGGPLLDREGKVLGIITLKSAITANLGFAMPVNELRQLIAHPNPVAMKNWLTIGALNAGLWRPAGGGDVRWSQRAGVIQVRGMGGGFGGRSQCLAVPPPPALPYEISVRVKLDDESGAAGLSFCSDGGDIHYGFYPSNGGMRLTRFEGPDVASWTILSQTTPEAQKAGDWNLLRVRVEPDRILCYVNGALAVESTDTALRSGAAGLCQFRGTEASFRGFAIGSDLKSATAEASPALSAAITALSAGAEPTPGLRASLIENPQAARILAGQEAATLEKRAATLRQAAAQAGETAVSARLGKLLAAGDEAAIPLAEAALLLAELDNPDVDPAASLAEIQRMASSLRDSLTDADRASPETTLAALNRWMFQENGFHGPRDDFSHPSNSHLNEVIDDREGLPITLAILHIELARRIGLPVVGIGLPGRFLTQLQVTGHAEGGPYIDVFEGGRLISRQEASALALEATGTLPSDDTWQPAGKRDIILRMISNLARRAAEQEDTPQLLRCLGAQAAIEPLSPQPRLQRFMLLTRAGRRGEARADAAWLLEHRPPGTSEEQLREMLGGF